MATKKKAAPKKAATKKKDSKKSVLAENERGALVVIGDDERGVTVELFINGYSRFELVGILSQEIHRLQAETLNDAV